MMIRSFDIRAEAFFLLVERRAWSWYDEGIKQRRCRMKNLLAGGFLFVGGAIIMTTTQFGHVIPMIGAGCALLGFGMLLYYLFSDDGKY